MRDDEATRRIEASAFQEGQQKPEVVEILERYMTNPVLRPQAERLLELWDRLERFEVGSLEEAFRV